MLAYALARDYPRQVAAVTVAIVTLRAAAAPDTGIEVAIERFIYIAIAALIVLALALLVERITTSEAPLEQ